jgi:hypothetical protein
MADVLYRLAFILCRALVIPPPTSAAPKLLQHFDANPHDQRHDQDHG